MGLGRQDFSGKKLAPQEADAVIADLKTYLLGIADKWLIKGRFHTDMGSGTLPMEAIKIFWQIRRIHGAGRLIGVGETNQIPQQMTSQGPDSLG